MEISVIICTHNPRPDYLHRVLAALKGQTLAMIRWELLLVDNASAAPGAADYDLSWHPRGRHVHEGKTGLTHARLRGILETTGELLVYVDDDNVLEPDYLEQILAIAQSHARLGAWSGQVIPEFEVEPDPLTRPALFWLCIRKLNEDRWGNGRVIATLPTGAGLCVRRTVAERFKVRTESDARALQLDRIGTSLGGWGDYDLALCSLDLGLGTGLFAALRLTHLIPARRLDRKYLLRLIEETSATMVIFHDSRGMELPPPYGPKQPLGRLRWWLRWLRVNAFLKQSKRAELRGLKKGHAQVQRAKLQAAMGQSRIG